MKIELDFTEKEIDMLFHTGMEAFIDQEGRFEELKEGDWDIIELYVSSSPIPSYFRWCNTFLEAKILVELLKNKFDQTPILLFDTGCDEWVVWSVKPLK